MPAQVLERLDEFVADFDPGVRPHLRLIEGGLGQAAMLEHSAASRTYGLDGMDLTLLDQISRGVPIPKICQDQATSHAAITEHALSVTEKLGVPTMPSAVRKVIAKEILLIEFAPTYERPHLTPLEYKIIMLVSRGIRNNQIARLLPPGPDSLANKITPGLRSKLGAESNAHAVRRAFELTILKIPPVKKQS